MIQAAVATVLECYPAVFFACHRAHVRDERKNQVLSSRQAGVLDHLDTIEPLHLHELARHLGVTASTMSLMIDRLERGGYVRRSRDKADVRRVNIQLTRAGARIKDQQKVLDATLVEAMLRRLRPDECASALQGLRTLARAAAELAGSEGAGARRREIGA